MSREITKSVRGLLVPFICWTIISAFLRHSDSMLEYFWAVVKSPDVSLWFLFVLFWCRMIFLAVHSVWIKLLRKHSVFSLVYASAVIFAVSTATSKLLLPRNFLGVSMFATHFPYFTAGVLLYQYRERLSGFLDSIPANMAVIVMFVIIAPFWYIDSPNPAEMKLAEVFGNGRILFKIIQKTAAIPGIFLIMSLTKIILRSDFKPLIKSLAFTGELTLGIYTLHFYFLGMFPPVILPLSASIILTLITEKIPAVRSLLLGK